MGNEKKQGEIDSDDELSGVQLSTNKSTFSC